MTERELVQERHATAAHGILALRDARPDRHGAKAGNLARVIDLGLPVPRGFVLEESAIECLIDSKETLLALLEDFEERVIVRSSALGEDSASASFAGQLESVICSNSPYEVLRAIERCRASYRTASASTYGQRLDARLDGLSLLLQEFREAQVSGVLFTRSPLVQDNLRIELCSGACSQLVEGRINPGAVEIGREDLSFREESALGLLPRARLEELARLGLRLEGLIGQPVDVEWCFTEACGFEVVQVRPITVAPAARPVPSIQLSRSNIGENYPESVCPLLYSVARESYYHYFRNLGRAFGLKESELGAAEASLRHVLGSQAGCLYYNLSSIYACFGHAPAGGVIQDHWKTFLSVREDASLGFKNKHAKGTRASTFFAKMANVAGIARLVTHGIVSFLRLDKSIGAFERSVSLFHLEALRAKSQPEFAEALSRFRYLRMNAWLPASLADAAAMFGIGFLKTLLGRAALDDPSLLAKLLEAGPGMESAKPLHELAELEKLIAVSQKWKSLFLMDGEEKTLDCLRSEQDSSQVSRKFFAYLEKWGYRSAGELLLTRPTLLDEPVRLVSLLRTRLTQGTGVQSGSSNGGMVISEKKAQGEFPVSVTPRDLRKRLGTARYLAALCARRLTSWGVNHRERARLKQAQLYHGLRRVALGMGALLAKEGVMTHRDDVFYLTLDELEALAGGSFHLVGTVGGLVRLRKAECEAQARLRAPQTIGLTYQEWLLGAGSAAAAAQVASAASDRCSQDEGSDENVPRVMRGLAASPGLARGRICVIRSLDEIGAFVPGTILVARYTDPGWTPYFAQAKGLVLEYGGLLCHGAIVAREFGIPTVTEVQDALDRLVDGMEVTIDGTAGWIRIES